MKKLITTLALVAFATQAGCFGSFKLTSSMYNFNKNVSDSVVVQEVVFLVMIILPVYEIGMFIDGIALNLIEFITGSNPIASHTQTMDIEGGTVVMTRSGRSIEVWIQREGQEEQRHRITRERRGWTITDDSGLEIMRLERDGHGGVKLTDATGQVTSYDAAAMSQATSSYWAGGVQGLVASLRPTPELVTASR